MLTVSNHESFYRVASVDPGTDTLGTAILDVNLYTGRVALIDATTYRGERMSRSSPDVIATHGGRWGKLCAHESSLVSWLLHYRPHALICESPFLGRFPQAFEALVECKTFIRRALVQYDPYLPLETIDPPSAKIAVGAPGKGKDKTAIRDAILKLQNLDNHSGKQIHLMDEHSTDAIAVGYYKCLQIINFVRGGV